MNNNFFYPEIDELKSVITFLTEVKGIKQVALAEKLGVCESQLVKLKNGKVTKVANYLTSLKDIYKNELLNAFENLPTTNQEMAADLRKELREMQEEIKELHKKLDLLLSK